MIRFRSILDLMTEAGFDIMCGDPTGSSAVTPKGMRRIGARIGRFRARTLVVQEGGYCVRNLRAGAHAVFDGTASARCKKQASEPSIIRRQ